MPFATVDVDSDLEKLCVAVCVCVALFALARAYAIRRGRFEPNALRAALARRAISDCPVTREALARAAHRSITGYARLLPHVALAHMLAVLLTSVGVSAPPCGPWSLLETVRFRLLHHWLESGSGYAASLLVWCGSLLVYAAAWSIANTILGARGHHLGASLALHEARRAWGPPTRVALAFAATTLVVVVTSLIPTNLDGDIGRLSVDPNPCVEADLALAMNGRDAFTPVGAASERRLIDEGRVGGRSTSVCLHVAEGLTHGDVTRALDSLAGRGVEVVRIALP